MPVSAAGVQMSRRQPMTITISYTVHTVHSTHYYFVDVLWCLFTNLSPPLHLQGEECSSEREGVANKS